METLELELVQGGARFKNAKHLRDTLNNPQKLLKKIGSVILVASQRSFDEQRLGENVWPARYPNQQSPKINVAAALRLLNEGASLPKGGHSIFKDRPALKGHTMDLRKSLAKNNADAMKMVGPLTVEVGSNLPYAPNMQFGIKSEQPVTGTAKTTLANWLRLARQRRRRIASYDAGKKTWVQKSLVLRYGTWWRRLWGISGQQTHKGTAKPKKRKKKQGGKIEASKPGTPKASRSRGGGSESRHALKGDAAPQFEQATEIIQALGKLKFLFGRSTLITTPVARPFIGITKELGSQIRDMVEKAVGDQQAADAQRQQDFRAQAPRRKKRGD
jgi:phage gpG-like protein